MKKYKIGKLFFVILLGVGSFLIYQGISLINAETLVSEMTIDTSTSSLSVTNNTTVTTTNFPVCGLANGQVRTTMPTTTTDLCLYGMVLSLGGSGPWTWSCYANGTTVSCATSTTTTTTTTTTSSYPVCGSANNQVRTTMPTTTAELCSYGMYLSLSGSGPWTWKCYANGISVNCATATTTTTTSSYPVCGSANNQVRTTAPTTTAELCSYGTYSSLLGSGPWTWSCYANGTSVSCATTAATTTTTTTTTSYYPVCGLANGQVRTTMPSTTADLCSYGTYSSLAGSGPWTWSCYANGTSVSCATASTATTVSATTSEISYTTSTTIDTGTTLPTLTISATQIYDTIDTSIKYYKVTVLSNIASFLTKVKIRVFDDAGTQFSEVIISTPEPGSTGKTWTTTLAIPISATERVWTIKVIDYEYSSFSDTTYSYLNYTYSSGTNPITTITVPAQVIITPAQCYTDWSDCVGGIQTRELIYPLPSGCISTATEALTRTCLVELETCSSYTFSDWSNCINNKRTRSVLEQYPPNCILGSIILEESCQSNSEDTTTIIQPETTPDPTTPNNPEPQDEPEANSDTNSETTPIVAPSVESNSPTTPNTNNTTINNAGTNNTTNTTTTNNTTNGTTGTATTNNNPDNSLFETSPAPQAPLVEKECLVMGITSQGECQIYLYQSKIYQECLGLNLTNKNQCFQYFLNKYGKPIKCQGLSEAECNLLINEVILADFKIVITEEVKNTLSGSVGATAVINTQTQVLTINPTDPQSTKPIELNVQSLPLASSNGEVSVSLAPVSLSKNQEILAPVAIVFDENKNGIPDEIEIRSGITPENQEEVISQMTGVEKAIVQKEPLEQPKFNDSVKTSETLLIESVENVNSQVENGSNKNNVRFKGKAKPNQVITLFIYSSMPIVLTVKTDENGNWVYDLNKDLVDGKHEVYVSINNDKGKIIETSLAKLFFIEEAKAVSMDEFTDIQDATSVPDQVNMLLVFYLLSGFIAILFFVAIFLIIKQRLTK